MTPDKQVTFSWEPGLPPSSPCGTRSPSSASTGGASRFSKDMPYTKKGIKRAQSFKESQNCTE